jgi:hypothetical protein
LFLHIRAFLGLPSLAPFSDRYKPENDSVLAALPGHPHGVRPGIAFADGPALSSPPGDLNIRNPA